MTYAKVVDSVTPHDTRFSELVEKDDVPSVIEALSVMSGESCRDNLETIMTLIDHRSYAMREAAVRLLGDMVIEEALPKIIEKAGRESEKDRHVRQRAVNALASFRGHQVVTALEMALGDPALNVRRDAEESLQTVRGESG